LPAFFRLSALFLLQLSFSSNSAPDPLPGALFARAQLRHVIEDANPARRCRGAAQIRSLHDARGPRAMLRSIWTRLSACR
jgi:hypothetical protein